MSDSVRPHRRQSTRLPRPWDSPGKNTGVGCHFPLQCMKVKSESEVTQSCPTPVTPWTATHQASPSMGLSRQEYWSGLPLPSPVILNVCEKNYKFLVVSSWLFFFLSLSLLDSSLPGSLDPDAPPLRRRQWHPTPVLSPGKSHGRRSLVGCSPWGR